MADDVMIMDGGMGRLLKEMGAPFRQPEWSALALMEAPDCVEKAHQQEGGRLSSLQSSPFIFPQAAVSTEKCSIPSIPNGFKSYSL